MTIDPAAIPLSLSYYTVPELTPPEAVTVAAAAGCRHVGLRLLGSQPGRDPMPIMTDTALRRETLDRLADSGLSVLDVNTARLIPETEIAAFGPFLELAAEFGARHILASGDDPDEARLTANFAGLAEAAHRLGLTIDIEFVPWFSVNDLNAAAQMVRAVDAPNLGITVDALHFDRSAGSCDELAHLPPAWFRYAQICDAPAGGRRDRDALIHAAVRERLFPGEGAIDLIGLLRALPPGIPLALEIPTEQLAKSVGALERVRRAVAATRRVLAAALVQD
ncbi:MAG: sugar phosphate isomerase/epimerase [Alphaproteobacteria bacterium]|nr:sugar phosphate isomerase/epimerase [Alphaproteobacteria bacterium]